jgi:hypothetical protein
MGGSNPDPGPRRSVLADQRQDRAEISASSRQRLLAATDAASNKTTWPGTNARPF